MFRGRPQSKAERSRNFSEKVYGASSPRMQNPPPDAFMLQTTSKPAATINEEPEFASFAPRSSKSTPKTQSQRRRRNQPLLRKLHRLFMSFPCFLICFLLVFTMYWVYKYSLIKNHPLSRSDFGVTSDKMRRNIEDNEENRQRRDDSKKYESKIGGSKDSWTKASNVTTNGSQTYYGRGDIDGVQGIGITLGRFSRGGSKDGDRIGSERSGQESVRNGGPGVVYEDIGSDVDDGNQVDKSDGGNAVNAKDKRGVRQDVDGLHFGTEGGNLAAWRAIGLGKVGDRVNDVVDSDNIHDEEQGRI